MVKSQNDALQNELDELKKLNEFTNIPTDYKVKKAVVKSGDIEGWNSKLLIDVGSKDDIEEGIIIITTEGMIGKISSEVNLVQQSLYSLRKVCYGSSSNYD